MARPPKFESVQEFEGLINAYFIECKNEEKIASKAGLALALDTTRETLGDYEKKEGFSDTLKRAYQMIEEGWVQKLGGTTQVTGAIFYLKNAFSKDYRDKHELDHTTKGDKITGFNYIEPGEGGTNE